MAQDRGFRTGVFLDNSFTEVVQVGHRFGVEEDSHHSFEVSLYGTGGENFQLMGWFDPADPDSYQYLAQFAQKLDRIQNTIGELRERVRSLMEEYPAND